MVIEGTRSSFRKQVPQTVIRVALEEELLCVRLIDRMEEQQQQILELPGITPMEQLDAADVIRRGSPEKELKGALSQLLSTIGRNIPLDQTILLFGGTADPFFPFEGKFDSALRILEQLALLQAKLVCIQTRSPLVVLALPVLKSLGRGAAVTIALEALNDTDGNRYTPQLPRPSERIKAARALKNLGVRTIIQASTPPLRTGLSHCAGLLDEVGDQIYLSDWFSLAGKNIPLTKPNSEKRLERLLLKLAPQKFAENPLDAWNARGSSCQSEELGAEAA